MDLSVDDPAFYDGWFPSEAPAAAPSPPDDDGCLREDVGESVAASAAASPTVGLTRAAVLSIPPPLAPPMRPQEDMETASTTSTDPLQGRERSAGAVPSSPRVLRLRSGGAAVSRASAPTTGHKKPRDSPTGSSAEDERALKRRYVPEGEPHPLPMDVDAAESDAPPTTDGDRCLTSDDDGGGDPPTRDPDPDSVATADLLPTPQTGDDIPDTPPDGRFYIVADRPEGRRVVGLNDPDVPMVFHPTHPICNKLLVESVPAEDLPTGMPVPSDDYLRRVTGMAHYYLGHPDDEPPGGLEVACMVAADRQRGLSASTDPVEDPVAIGSTEDASTAAAAGALMVDASTEAPDTTPPVDATVPASTRVTTDPDAPGCARLPRSPAQTAGAARGTQGGGSAAAADAGAPASQDVAAAAVDVPSAAAVVRMLTGQDAPAAAAAPSPPLVGGRGRGRGRRGWATAARASSSTVAGRGTAVAADEPAGAAASASAAASPGHGCSSTEALAAMANDTPLAVVLAELPRHPAVEYRTAGAPLLMITTTAATMEAFRTLVAADHSPLLHAVPTVACVGPVFTTWSAPAPTVVARTTATLFNNFVGSTNAAGFAAVRGEQRADQYRLICEATNIKHFTALTLGCLFSQVVAVCHREDPNWDPLQSMLLHRYGWFVFDVPPRAVNGIRALAHDHCMVVRMPGARQCHVVARRSAGDADCATEVLPYLRDIAVGVVWLSKPTYAGSDTVHLECLVPPGAVAPFVGTSVHIRGWVVRAVDGRKGKFVHPMRLARDDGSVPEPLALSDDGFCVGAALSRQVGADPRTLYRVFYGKAEARALDAVGLARIVDATKAPLCVRRQTASGVLRAAICPEGGVPGGVTPLVILVTEDGRHATEATLDDADVEAVASGTSARPVIEADLHPVLQGLALRGPKKMRDGVGGGDGRCRAAAGIDLDSAATGLSDSLEESVARETDTGSGSWRDGPVPRARPRRAQPRCKCCGARGKTSRSCGRDQHPCLRGVEHRPGTTGKKVRRAPVEIPWGAVRDRITSEIPSPAVALGGGSRCLPHEPPADLALRVVSACHATIVDIPRAAVPCLAFAMRAWMTSLAWLQYRAQVAGEPLPSHPAVLVGPSLVLRAPAGVSDIRRRVALALEGRWGDLEKAVDADVKERRRARVSEPATRARHAMSVGAVGRATRLLSREDDNTGFDVNGTIQSALPFFPPEPDGEAIPVNLDPPDRIGEPLSAPRRGPLRWRVMGAITDDSLASLPPFNPSPVALSCDKSRRAEVESTAAAHFAQAAVGTPFWSKTNAEAWQSLVVSALGRIGRLSQPGPSGLRAEHLHHALSYLPMRDECEEALASVVNWCCWGQAPAALADNRLFLIPKGGGGHRPLGAGEVLRRVACRVALPSLVDVVGPRCETLGQWGTSRSGAARAVIAVRRAVRSGAHVLSVDLRNAFNSVNRAEVLRHVPSDAPARRLIWTLYGGPVRMLAPGAAPVTCSRGVVQGCPLAAALFANAITLGPIAAARAAMAATDSPSAAAAAPSAVDSGESVGAAVTDVWYADDGHVLSTDLNKLARFGEVLASKCAAVGMELAVRKTSLMLNGDVPDDDIPDWLADPSRITRVDFLHTLGVPCAAPGRFAVEREEIDRLLDNHIVDMQKIVQLDHPQHILAALMQSGPWSRAGYLLSLVSDDAFEPAMAERMDSAAAGVLMAALGPWGVLMPRSAFHPWLQACLPLRLGGLGIQSCVSLVTEARRRVQGDGLGVSCPASDDPSVGTRRAAQPLTRLPDPVPMIALRPLLDGWSKSRDDNVRWHAARLRGLAAGRGSAGAMWLRHPADRVVGTLLPRDEAAAALAVRLGLPVLLGTAAGRECPLSCVHRKELDEQGRHTMACLSYAVGRHNRVRDAIAAVLGGDEDRFHPLGAVREGGFPRGNVVREVGCGPGGAPVLSPLRDPTVPATRDGDVAVRVPGDGHWRYLDVTVAAVRAAAAGARDGDVTARDARTRKLARAAPYGARGAVFEPVAMSVLGHVDGPSESVIRGLADEAQKLDPIRPIWLHRDRTINMMARVGAAVAGGVGRAIVDTCQKLGRPAEAGPVDRDAVMAMVARESELMRTVVAGSLGLAANSLGPAAAPAAVGSH